MIFTSHSLVRLYERDNYDEQISKEEVLKDIKDNWKTLTQVGCDLFRVNWEYFMYILTYNKLITILKKRQHMSPKEWKEAKKRRKAKWYKTITLDKKTKRDLKGRFNFKKIEFNF